MSSAPPTIHVIDDDPSFRAGISRLLKTCGYRVAAYESAHQFLESSARDGPGCILLDVRMQGLSGPELQARLAGTGNDLPIVFLTGQADIPTTVQAMRAGVEDFLTKPVSKRILLPSIERALVRYGDMRKKNALLTSLRVLIGALTPREKEVFILIVHGKRNKQIAYELGTSERTIKAHRHAVMEKMQVKSVAEAAAIAERLGMLSDARS
jgi:FixJ family two-component response regulator